MITTSIESLESLLEQARQKGCSEVKLQLYDNWNEVIREQKQPAHPVDEYQVDVRFYNTVEFDTEILNQVATDKIVTRVERDTLIIRVSLSDRETLLNNLGLDGLL